MCNGLPKIYSQDLLYNLFRHPYTKIEFIMNELQVSRPTATTYLEALVENGMLGKVKLGRSNFYMNMPLFNLLKDGGVQQQQAPAIITKNDMGYDV